jgi:subtilisin family serine protease
MSRDTTRRDVLRGAGVVVGAAVVGPRVVEARTAESRFFVDMSTTSMGALSSMEVVYDFREQIGYAVVEGEESAMPDGATYTSDVEIEIETPAEETMGMDAREAAEPFYDLQWDKQEQKIRQVHRTATGSGARIGIVDDGVLGANPDRDVVHPDLPNVRPDLSANFTDDGNGPGPLNDDHGTHCAGTAAAVDNGVGVVGMAPDAELVDLRVFSGTGASFADITAAVLVGAAPEGAPVNVGTAENPEVYTGAGCDVLNLSLGTGPLPPTEPVKALQDAQAAAAGFALDNGCLPIASAGNDGTNLDASPEGFDESFVNLPAEAEGYMSIGAAGPIGFGWPAGEDDGTVAGFPVGNTNRVELPTEEPASYTNYGAEAVDVTAGGGNFDTDAVAGGANAFYDLVFSTGIANLLPPDPDGDGVVENPEDVVLDEYVPGYVFKAGTSFSAPNVAGLAALLASVDPSASPGAIREQIETTAKRFPVGRAAETTAPGEDPNEASDGDFDGDKPSSPGSNPGRISPELYRGEGHIDTLTAVRTFGAGGGPSGDGEADGGGPPDDAGSGDGGGPPDHAGPGGSGGPPGRGG